MGDNTSHSKLSMSSAHRWMKCSGSVFMALAYPEGESSEYAKEGTRAHAVAEKILRVALTEGISIGEAWGRFRLECDDEEMQAHVLGYAEAARGLLPMAPENIAIERKFMLSEDYGIGGTADFCFTNQSSKGKTGVILDLKYGAGVAVEVEGNEQLIGYICSMHNDPDWGPLDHGVVYIYQPRVEHPDGLLRRMELDREALNDWTYRLMARGKEIKEALEAGGQGEYVPGDHCRWCRGEAVCTANQNHLSISAEVDFLPVVQEDPKAPATLEPEQLAKILKYRPIIESYFKRVEEWCLAELKAGRQVPGLKLVKGRSVRRWLASEEFVADKLKTMGVDPWAKKLRGITEVEKELGKGKLAGLTEQSEAALKVTTEDDKRPAVALLQTEAELDFEF